ncbi:MAG: hypothetical protein II721_04100 [Bacilli bacterium]|nr:hypothetical protein [Bacilli bacterium]
MKKPLFLLSLPLMLCALSSCGGGSATPSTTSSSGSASGQDTSSSETQPENQKQIDELKALLSKQDTSPIYNKQFVCFFSQDYQYFLRNYDEDEEETNFYSYRGSGQFGCIYEVSKEAYEEAYALDKHDCFDFLSRGTGRFEFSQSATITSYLRDMGEDVFLLGELSSGTFLQGIEIEFTEPDVQIYNALIYATMEEGTYPVSQNFNGIIEKDILFNEISVRSLSDIIARTNIYDGQRSCEVIDELYFDTVRSLTGKTDKELGEFITNNKIEMEEDEENNILLHFEIHDESIRGALDERDITPGILKGTLTYEKESGRFINFDYGVVYLKNEVDEATGNAYTATMEFKANGYSFNQKYEGEVYIDPDANRYEDAQTFIDDMVKEVIPPAF